MPRLFVPPRQRLMIRNIAPSGAKSYEDLADILQFVSPAFLLRALWSPKLGASFQAFLSQVDPWPPRLTYLPSALPPWARSLDLSTGQKPSPAGTYRGVLHLPAHPKPPWSAEKRFEIRVATTLQRLFKSFRTAGRASWWSLRLGRRLVTSPGWRGERAHAMDIRRKIWPTHFTVIFKVYGGSFRDSLGQHKAHQSPKRLGSSTPRRNHQFLRVSASHLATALSPSLSVQIFQKHSPFVWHLSFSSPPHVCDLGWPSMWPSPHAFISSVRSLKWVSFLTDQDLLKKEDQELLFWALRSLIAFTWGGGAGAAAGALRSGGGLRGGEAPHSRAARRERGRVGEEGTVCPGLPWLVWWMDVFLGSWSAVELWRVGLVLWELGRFRELPVVWWHLVLGFRMRTWSQVDLCRPRRSSEA